MKMLKVESSCIKSIGYEEEKNELFVEFNSGKIYKYPNCSKTLYENFMNSTSKGRFLNDYFVGSIYEKVN
jgi:poly-gamma-glutamate capsule biosynthesis protein CapA/YwtB (metallophosphatase superfamily)